MRILYTLLLLVYLGFGLLTAPDIPYLWDNTSLLGHLQFNVVIILLIALYFWGALKIVFKILRYKKTQLNDEV